MSQVGYHFSTSLIFRGTRKIRSRGEAPPELLKNIDIVSKQYPTGQIFISSPQQLGNKDITKRVPAKQLEDIKKLIKKRKFKLFIHANYLINLARPIKDNKAGLNSLIAELKSAEVLGAKGVVVHVGKNTNSEVGVKYMISNIVYVLLKTTKYNVKLLLESSAGVGNELGSTIAEFGEIVNGVINKIKALRDRVPKNNFGVCIDTAHLHSSGINLSAAGKFVKEFQQTIGWKHVKVIHFNDSKRELGSHVDRHETVGMGYISVTGLKLIARTAKRFGIPLILERRDNSGIDDEIKLVVAFNLRKAQINMRRGGGPKTFVK